jgi:hypothetical protein
MPMSNNTIDIPYFITGEFRRVTLAGNRVSIIHHGLNNQGRPFTYTVYDKTFLKTENAEREYAKVSTKEGLERKCAIIRHNALVMASQVGVPV